MKCCNCNNIELEPTEIEKGLLVAGCPSCNSALLPLMNYRYWSEHSHDVEKQVTSVAEEVSGAKQCPKCQRIMTKFKLGSTTENNLELCGHCDEVWLDAGEWALVKNLDLHENLSSVFTEAWQRNIRKQKQANSIKEHYRELIGEVDFTKLDNFKQWLDAHPKKAELKHFITINFSQ